MAKKILLTGILGGLALFLWGGLSHMVLGLGEAGVQTMPQPQPVIDAMKTSLPHSGFYYFFPQTDSSGKVLPQQANDPWGIVIYHPSGAHLVMTGQLARECILNIVEALLGAFLLSLAPGLATYFSRVGFVLVIGLLLALSTNLEYWIWYGFPTRYTAGIMTDKFIGFLIVALVAGALIKAAPVRIQAVPAKAA